MPFVVNNMKIEIGDTDISNLVTSIDFGAAVGDLASVTLMMHADKSIKINGVSVQDILCKPPCPECKREAGHKMDCTHGR